MIFLSEARSGIATSDSSSIRYEFAPVEPVTVQEGAGFLLRFKSNPSFGALTLLEVIDYSGDRWPIPMDNLTEQTSPKGFSLNVAKMVIPDDINEYVVRVRNVITSGTWKLLLKNERGQNINQGFTINVIKRNNERTCPGNSDAYCSITERNTQNSYKCGSPESTTIKNYLCKFLTEGVMPQREIKGKEDEMKKCVEEESFNGGKIFSNQLYEAEATIKSCYIMNTRTGMAYNIRDSWQDTRYSSLRTSFKKKMCQFEIPAPLIAEDAGKWVLYVKYQSKDRDEKVQECPFKIKLPGDLPAWKEEVKKPIVIVKHKNDFQERNLKVDLTCVQDTPYDLHRCYMVMDSKIKSSGDTAEGCHSKIPLGALYDFPFTKDMKCGFNGPTKDDPDYIRDVQIKIFNNYVINERFNETANTLECQHIYESPITSCFFMSPDKKLYSVPSSAYKDDTFSAFGGSFDTGNCGIQFLTRPAAGIWKCTIETTDNQLYSTDINVN